MFKEEEEDHDEKVHPKYKSHDHHMANLHLGNFRPEDVHGGFRKEKEKNKKFYNESMDAHIAGFTKHLDKDVEWDLEKEISKSIKTPEYDALNQHYKDAHKDEKTKY